MKADSSLYSTHSTSFKIRSCPLMVCSRTTKRDTHVSSVPRTRLLLGIWPHLSSDCISLMIHTCIYQKLCVVQNKQDCFYCVPTSMIDELSFLLICCKNGKNTTTLWIECSSTTTEVTVGGLLCYFFFLLEEARSKAQLTVITSLWQYIKQYTLFPAGLTTSIH